MSLVSVDRPEQFSLVTAEQTEAHAQLNVTGAVNPDIAREVPVISLASGRVVDIKARLGDDVRKGQLLLKVQSPDITNAFDVYLKAVNDEQLANKADVRAKDLFEHGAISRGMLEQADDTEKDALADLGAAEQQLDTLGVDKAHPTPIVNVYAPISGVIIAQNVTNAAAAGVTYAGTPTAFTIADLSVVWILCDVYENDLPKIAFGQSATIRTNAYPGQSGNRENLATSNRSSIPPFARPRSASRSPTPAFSSSACSSPRPSTAKPRRPLRLFPLRPSCTCTITTGSLSRPEESNSSALQVNAGDMLPGSKQQILSGIAPGQQVVSDVLQLEATLEAQ